MVRPLSISFAVCCLTWLGVLWWWQRSERSVSEVDLLVYLGLLPLVLLLFLVALRHSWARAAGAAAVAHVSPEAGAESGAAGPKPLLASEELRHASLRLVHAAIMTTGGAHAGDLLQAAADGQPLPVPDGLLLSHLGLPSICARLPDSLLALEPCRSHIDPVIKRVGLENERWQAEQPSERVLRALAALREPLTGSRQWLLDEALRRQEVQALSENNRQRVRLILGCSSTWSVFETTLALRWVEALWAGDDDALGKFYSLEVTLVHGSGEDLWLKADQIAHVQQTRQEAGWLLLTAADSALDQANVNELSVAGRLLHTRPTPGGLVPGEAAATLLIAPPDWTAPADVAALPVRLHRPALLQRGKPIDAAGKVDAEVLRQAIDQATKAARLPIACVAALVCDADQHSPRVNELYGATSEDLPQLDPLDDMRSLAKVTGHTGVASCLLVVACAGEWVRTLARPVLALGLADSRMRLALVIQPDHRQDAATLESAPAHRTS